MRPEVELLVCCARLHLTVTDVQRITALVGQSLDWSYLQRTARWHGLTPFLYRHLKEIEPDAFRECPLADLHSYVQRNAKRNLYLASELAKVLRSFETHGLSSVAFKGPMLAVGLYGNIALREFLDLDILVRRDDVPKITSLMASHFYEPLAPLTAAQEAHYLRTHCERTFLRADVKSYIDLHWAITSDLFHFPICTDDLLRRLEPASLMGTEVKTLNRTDLLLILCVNTAKDAFVRLEPLCAIAELLRAGDVDWTRVRQMARDVRCERRFSVAVALAHDLLDVALPVEILQKLQTDEAVKSMVWRVRARLFRDDLGPLDKLEKNYVRFRLMDRRRHAISAILKAAVSPNLPDWTFISLPSSLFFLYYLVRPVRLILKYGLRSLKL